MASLTRRTVVAGAVLAPFAARAQSSGQSSGQSWPSGPIRIIVPFPAGGSVDAVARLAQAGLQQRLGVSVVVENRSGASGSTGTALVAKSPPDGSTWLVTFDNHAVNPMLLPNFPFDNQKDLDPVSLIGTAPYMVATHPAKPYNALADVIDAAKKAPGKVSYGSVGSGSIGHLAMVLLSKQAGIELTHVPYRGGAPAVNDALAGHIDLVNGSVALLTPHVAAGRLRPLWQHGAQRLPAHGTVPTIGEAGFPGAQASAWWGCYAPAKTPKEFIERFRTALVASLREDKAARMLTESQQMNLLLTSPEALRKFELEQTQIWGGVVRENGIKGE
ncbi:MAG TPA: tripartite tricarboxylate transporter substrate binding protein [Xanthobacteraceae bacterium]|nr:tripartite tricarboxylate transporter substrate binding protein [Xanthobacteraceae bacterium]